MRRRTFMGLVAGSAGAVTVLGMRRANAAFGAFPAGSEAALLPDGVRAKRVLEIFLYGGLSPWETLYFVPEYGDVGSAFPGTQYYTFASANDAMMSPCGNGTVRGSRPFAADANGKMVELGPFADKLFKRTDITDRMRIVVQKHTLEPHEAAVPQALTGRPVGQPTAAGLGAHVQRARIEAGDTRAEPHSYVFATGGVSSDNVAAAASSGAHPGAARPLLIKTDHAADFTSLLSRPGVGANRAHNDALVQAYVDQYQGRLTWPGQGRVRSPRTDDLDIAFATTTKVDALSTLLGGSMFATQAGASCGRSATRNIPLVGLDAAARLLTHPTTPASYVCVSDVGLVEASGGGGYDTHTDNAHDTAMNFDNMLQALLTYIDDGTHKPNTFSLDDTLVIINTEFGRTPNAQGANGRNHHPYGYVTAFIGGPITSAQKGVFGAIDADGTANGANYATPAENRIAGLLALGIWPYAPEAFAVSDIRDASTELAGAKSVIKKFFARDV